MLNKMKQMYDMQKQAKQVQKSVESIQIEGEGAGGKIKVVMNGAFKIESIAIDESFLDPSKKQALEKALADTLSDTAEEVGKKSAEQAMAMMKDMNFKLPGM